jgi:hypothetical protein
MPTTPLFPLPEVLTIGLNDNVEAQMSTCASTKW